MNHLYAQTFSHAQQNNRFIRFYRHSLIEGRRFDEEDTLSKPFYLAECKFITFILFSIELDNVSQCH